MSSFPIFPKVGQHVRFDKEYGVYNYATQSPVPIDIGTIAEVVEVKAHLGSQEMGSYILYLGLENGNVITLNYTLHYSKITIIPSTPAGQVLYGNK
jgi:hypothetical protein